MCLASLPSHLFRSLLSVNLISVLEIHCPAPEKIANGTVYARSIRFNATAKYKCANGFRLVGSEQTRCDETGAWKPDAPVCYGKYPMVQIDIDICCFADWVSFRKFFADDNHSNETSKLW
jgi:hypothetical protein